MQSRLYRFACLACFALLPTALCSGESLDVVPPDLAIRSDSDVAFLIGGSKDPPYVVPPHERAVLSSDVRELVAGNNQFAIDLFRRLSAGEPASANMFASPFSISSALGMTYAGARGRTAAQMADVLRFTLPQDRLHAAYGELVKDLDAVRPGYEMSVANRLFGEKRFEIQKSFLDVTSQHYAAPLERLDFIGDPNASRQHINRWVEDKTNDRIKDLLPDGSITEGTRLVLTNAIYFNGKWKYEFDEASTVDRPFQHADGSNAAVPTMFQQQDFRYGAFDGFKMLEMPYAGDDLSMVVMLPDATDGLGELEASLTTELLDESLAAMQSRDTQVFLPKFSFDASFGLAETLDNMGMHDAFRQADFSGIGAGDLAISDVLHKAFIDVNEAGTEAAAATAVIVEVTDALMGAPPKPEVFRADRPFLFALRDSHSGSLLFMGRVAEPGESKIAALGIPNVPEPASGLLLLMGAAFFRRVPR